MPTYKNRQCYFKANDIKYVDYKNLTLLRKFLTKFYKIVPKYYSGNSIRSQKMLAQAVKRARFMALIPYTR